IELEEIFIKFVSQKQARHYTWCEKKDLEVEKKTTIVLWRGILPAKKKLWMAFLRADLPSGGPSFLRVDLPTGDFPAGVLAKQKKVDGPSFGWRVDLPMGVFPAGVLPAKQKNVDGSSFGGSFFGWIFLRVVFLADVLFAKRKNGWIFLRCSSFEWVFLQVDLVGGFFAGVLPAKQKKWVDLPSGGISCGDFPAGVLAKQKKLGGSSFGCSSFELIFFRVNLLVDGFPAGVLPEKRKKVVLLLMWVVFPADVHLAKQKKLVVRVLSSVDLPSMDLFAGGFSCGCSSCSKKKLRFFLQVDLLSMDLLAKQKKKVGGSSFGWVFLRVGLPAG
ncbi:25640_t:CDS:2, partial [Racocetra persica]